MTGRNGSGMLGLQKITAHWWLFLIRGIIAILFGITAFAYPAITAVIFVFLFAGYVAADGILTLVSAVRFSHPDSGRWWWMLIQGVLGIAITAVALRPLPALISVVAIVLLIGAMRLVARRQIGGYTGDVLGATEQLGEALVLIVAASIH